MRIEAEIRAEMAKRNISDATMADALGLTRKYFNHKKNGHAPFTFNEVQAAANALGMPAWELMRRAEESDTPAA